MNDLPIIIARKLGYLVVDKPSGLLSQPGRGLDLSDSVLTRFRCLYPSAQLVHRLDQDTSGVILIALNPETHRMLSLLFEKRAIEKTYHAWCLGIPEGSSGFIVSPLAKYQDAPPRYRSHSQGRMAITGWERLEVKPDQSKLQLKPLTGRSHQLRVHLSEMGHPIAGDPLYGDAHYEAPRLMLHASELSFICPLAGKHVTFKSSCPF